MDIDKATTFNYVEEPTEGIGIETGYRFHIRGTWVIHDRTTNVKLLLQLCNGCDVHLFDTYIHTISVYYNNRL